MSFEHPSISTVQSSEDSDLIASLYALSAKSPKLVKSSIYSTPADPSIQVRSWKMNEFKYYDIPSPFPTLARGLFTREIPNDAQEKEEQTETAKKYQIIVRGYDKFFNIGEVPWTSWLSLETHTAAPYTLSLKSNGCIIFIAALTPTKLLITSKHSLGPVAGSEVSHAQAGEAWLMKYLRNKGKTEADLAARLWESNLTAIAELCDDSFEEHVLGYPPEKTGLHLHGLNVRSKEFKTLSTELVDVFADEWGFIKTPTINLNTIQEVRDFTNTCAETGEWNGEAVEGFVVRTHVTAPPTSTSKNGKRADVAASPYKPGSSFFFKVKFDEPYMMYRDWREVTKSLLSAKGPMTPSTLPKSKMKRAETKLYVKWVIQEIVKDPASFKEYSKGKGIIATREKFLEFLKTEQGVKELGTVDEKTGEPVVANKNFSKTIIVPVAIPGCGKTSVSLALAHIFGFGHTQSDDVHAKKAAPIFIKKVVDLLHKHDVVVADKNNHLKEHRQSLRDAASKFSQPVRLLALNWSLDLPRATIHRICGDRVQERGDNHQSLRADTSTKSHEEVIWMFINSTQELTPSEVDNVIEMELGESLEDAVRRAVQGCVSVMGLEMPSDEKIQEALDVVKGYAPAVKKPDYPKDKKKLDARYYGLLPEVDLEELLGPFLANENTDFWTKLKADNRVTKRPHVTIVHRNSINQERELWDRCAALHKMKTTPLFKGRLSNVVWDGRVMAITVEDFDFEGSSGGSDDEVQEGSASGGSDDEVQEGHEFVSKLPYEVQERLHITVGTKSEKVPAVEAKAMVQDWRKNGNVENNIQSIKLDDLIVYGRIKGLMN
ncbi:hypothetical protein BYT27DRAFT_7169897 [Phlegmacium glaucopus]|nr:hypothetical protein BYT27DRAFT_7169897 [Phlegmacium glaucopus]